MATSRPSSPVSLTESDDSEIPNNRHMSSSLPPGQVEYFEKHGSQSPHDSSEVLKLKLSSTTNESACAVGCENVASTAVLPVSMLQELVSSFSMHVTYEN